MEDKITVSCPRCKMQLRTPSQHVGKSAKCPKCQRLFKITPPLPETDMPDFEPIEKKADDANNLSATIPFKPDLHDYDDQETSTADVPKPKVLGLGSRFSKGGTRTPRRPLRRGLSRSGAGQQRKSSFQRSRERITPGARRSGRLREPEPGSRFKRSYGAERRGPTRKSGAVTAVAIINFIIGGLNAIFGILIVALGGLAFMASSALDSQKAMEASSIVMAVGVLYLFFGAFAIIAGIGVIMRQNWGRVLTLIMGFLALITAIMSIPAQLYIGLLLNGGYAVFVIIVMFNRKYGAEFS